MICIGNVIALLLLLDRALLLLLLPGVWILLPLSHVDLESVCDAELSVEVEI